MFSFLMHTNLSHSLNYHFSIEHHSMFIEYVVISFKQLRIDLTNRCTLKFIQWINIQVPQVGVRNAVDAITTA